MFGLLGLLEMLPGDDLVDLFPGSGITMANPEPVAPDVPCTCASLTFGKVTVHAPDCRRSVELTPRQEAYMRLKANLQHAHAQNHANMERSRRQLMFAWLLALTIGGVAVFGPIVWKAIK